MTVKLTVIDQTPIHEGLNTTTAPNASVSLALECEKLGYHRFWLAEHHDSVHFAGAAPEILVTRIASATKQMRVGTGGIMLTHYSPYKVAETFALLGGLFPGRIDLGVGRAPGGHQLCTQALASPGTPSRHEQFPQQAADLCAFLRGEFTSDHPYSNLSFKLEHSAMPSLWMLGSGGGSSKLAGQLGMGLALARFISPQTCSPEIFKVYAASYRQAGNKNSPPRLLALAVVCAPTDEEAQYIAGTAAYRKMMAGSYIKHPLLSPSEVASRYARMNSYERTIFDETLNDMIIGSPSTCRDRIFELAQNFECNEIGIVTVTYTHADRLRSYELLAKNFNLIPIDGTDA